MSKLPTDPVNFGFDPHAGGAGNSEGGVEGQQDQEPNPSTVPPLPQDTQAELLIAKLAECTIQNAQIQADNNSMLHSMQVMMLKLQNPIPKPLKLNVATPNPFDGTSKNYPTFIASLITQFSADPARYTSPVSCVWYALSLMKSGIAELWARRMINEINNGTYIISTWDNFELLMKTQFDTTHHKEDAQCNLVEFKQGSKTAKEFFACFEDYKADTGFNDETIVFYLKQNLNPGITSKIIYMPNQPVTYDQWKLAATFFDRQYCDHVARTKGSSSKNAPSKPKTTLQTTPPPTTTTTSSTTASAAGAPMDIDRVRGVQEFPDIKCWNCNKMGHYSGSCPKPSRRAKTATTSTASTSNSNPSNTPAPTARANAQSICDMYNSMDDDKKANFIRVISSDFQETSE